MKPLTIFFLVLFPMVLIAQTKPDTTTAQDSVVMSKAAIISLVNQLVQRRAQLAKEENEILAEENQLLGRIQILQAMLVDSTLQRRGKPRK